MKGNILTAALALAAAGAAVAVVITASRLRDLRQIDLLRDACEVERHGKEECMRYYLKVQGRRDEDCPSLTLPSCLELERQR